MIDRPRRAMLAGAVGAVCASALGAIASRSIAPAYADEGEERIIELVARRFSFSPGEIVVKGAGPLTLAITSIDFVHGFNVPDLGVRSDLMPGRVTKVRLVPTKAGIYDFLCDNFCGDGHEGMAGRLIVQE
jgi:cytochrome c oxidase subunit 2